jgi:hypothetical protein
VIVVAPVVGVGHVEEGQKAEAEMNFASKMKSSDKKKAARNLKSKTLLSFIQFSC